MTRLLLIDCQPDTRGKYRHAAYVNRIESVSIELDGVMADAGARAEFRNDPQAFIRKFDLAPVAQRTFKLR